MSGDESKQFLYAFLAKNGVIPEYGVRPTGMIFYNQFHNQFMNILF